MFSVSDVSLLVSRMLPEPHAGLMSGILFGTKSTMTSELYNALVYTGTLHIAALSGINITILTGFFGTVLKPLFSKRIASLLTVIIIIGFVWFVGLSASVVRAAIMGCLTLLGIVLGRQTWALWSLFITAGMMIAVHPLFISDISFQLSVGASLGLVLFGSELKINPGTASDSRTFKAFDKLAELFRFIRFGKAKNEIWIPESGMLIRPIVNKWEIGKWVSRILFNFENIIINNLRITLAAQVFTIPIILIYFRRISLVSPIANLLIGWAVGLVTILGMVTVILGLIFFPLGQAGAWFCWILLEYIVRAVYMMGKVPFGSVGY